MPSYRRERFEALVAIVIWVAAVTVTVGASLWLGSVRPGVSVGGVPRWIVFGVLTPWIAFFAIHVWYTLFFMSDDESDDT